MSASNLFAPPRYDERISRLAIGIEPRDALTGARLSVPLSVLLERHPRPLQQWRNWQPGETLDTVLQGLDRHRTGRYSQLYAKDAPASGVVVRLVDLQPGGRGAARYRRTIVPRRVQVPISAESIVAAPDANPVLPQHHLWRRVRPVHLFPGAAAPLPAHATVVRGRVTFTNARGEVEAVRWPRIVATDNAGDDVGWAHGDDRGEFVLVIGHPDTAVVLPASPMDVDIIVGAELPELGPPAPDHPSVVDPLSLVVDPLWDLPIEPLAPIETQDSAAITGQILLPGQSTFGPFEFQLPLGRETSLHLPIA